MKTKKITKLIITFVIALAIIIFVSVKLSKEGFQTIDPTNYPGGNFLGFRFKGSLQELTSTISQSTDKSLYTISDCSANTLWSSGSPVSSSTASNLYLIGKSGDNQAPSGVNLVNIYENMLQAAQQNGKTIVSMVFSNYEYPSPQCIDTGSTSTNDNTLSAKLKDIFKYANTVVNS